MKAPKVWKVTQHLVITDFSQCKTELIKQVFVMIKHIFGVFIVNKAYVLTNL